jgi:two-component system, cell cycle sensor histidine kinase and response regulator CckA
MLSESSPQFPWARILRVPRPAFAILTVLLIHIVLVAAFSHSRSLPFWSDLFQLAAILLSAVICFFAGRRSRGIARPFWLLYGAAFAIWSLGKCLRIYDFNHLGVSTVRIAPLLLYFLAAAPMFVTVFLSSDDFQDSLNWERVIDASQILGLILILYLFLVYVPLLYYGESVVNPLEDRLLLWRNIVLAAALLLRGLVSRSRTVRRLYLPVGVAIAVFAAATWFANRAQELSDGSSTSWWDLAWSVPFCAIAWFAASWDERDEHTTEQPVNAGISLAMFAYLPSLVLPVLLLWDYRHILREQIFLGLSGLIFSIILFNVRLLLTQCRQRLTAKALQAKESQYRSLFERNMAGVFRCTVQGKLLDCNPAYAKMFGYTREELLRIPLQELYFGGAVERDQSLARIAHDSPSQAHEICLRRKDGSALWVLVSANFEKQPSCEPLLEGTVIDITEKRALESQLRQAQKMEAIGRLAGGIAHDFNNLLTIISGYSSIQLERTLSSDPLHHEAEQIKAAADRAAALTRQLLAFSRQQVLQPRTLNLNDLVRSLDKMLRRVIGEDIEILTSLAPDLGIVRVDPSQVDQVLMNLIVNARDAMPHGGKLTIETENAQLDEAYARKHEYTKPGGYVMLAVSDSGVGMTPEMQARIFEPFFTTKEPGKGTGLGLPTVYGIVKQSGGSIEVYSEVNHGTSVKIYLPRVDGAVDVIPSVVPVIAATSGSERILVVEDDPLLKAMIVDILKARGYTVCSADKLDELEVIFQNAPKCDLLVTDIVMPKIKGPEVAARVAQHWPGIKILYMSGYTSEAMVHQGVANAGLSFLQKPFVASTLAARVREVLDAPPRHGIDR